MLKRRRKVYIARTMELDPHAHQMYLPAAEFEDLSRRQT